MRVGQQTILDALHGVKKLLEMGTDLILLADLDDIGSTRDLPHGSDDHRRSAGSDLGELLDLLIGDLTALDLPAKILRTLLERHVRD